MENKHKLILQVLFLFFVFGCTIYGIFSGEDLEHLSAILKTVNLYWLLPGIFCVIIFIWGESIILYYMMGSLKINLKKWSCFLFSSIGFFFSCITPSATGGQPAQLYYMKKEHIPLPVASLVLMVVTITYKLVLVVIGIGLLLFGGDFARTYLGDARWVFYLGIALNMFCVTTMLTLVFHSSLASDLMQAGRRILERIHLLKPKPQRESKLAKSMESYRQTAEYLRTHVMVIVNVFLITFFQRMALFLATWFVYRAFGLKEASIITIVLLQAAISVSVDMLPLPGGMGISEKLFLIIFAPFFGQKLLLPAMILSRGLGYYTQLLVSALFTGIGNFTIGKMSYERK